MIEQLNHDALKTPQWNNTSFQAYVGYIFYTEGSKLGLSCWLTQNGQKVVMYGTQNQRQEKNEGLKTTFVGSHTLDKSLD